MPRTENELQEIAEAIIEMLRPYHLRIVDIRDVLTYTAELLDYVVLREWPAGEKKTAHN